ncbi:MAG: nickel insertion protein, partial [Burkholderiales bacterium]
MAVAHVHLDPLGGVAGDMFLAALLDAFPEHADETFAAMRAAGLPDSWRTRLVRHDDGVLAGHRVAIEGPVDDPG